MPEKKPETSQEQIDRASRLHESIDQIKSGVPDPASKGKPKSIKEQVDERAAEIKEKHGPADASRD